MNVTITTTTITTQELPLQKRKPRLQRTNHTWAFISTVILIGFSCCISTTSAVHDSLLVLSAEDSSSSPRNISSTTTAANDESSSITSPEHPQQEVTFVKRDKNFFDDVTRKTQEVACLNNPQWVYSGPLSGGGVVSNNGNTETAVDCLSLYQTSSEAQRVEFCQMEEVRLNCPLTCGLCCEDDPTFLFPRFNGRYAGCGWLSGNQVRIDNNCDLLYSGTYVWSACPLTCGRCPAYVNLSPSTQPSDLPSSSPTHPPSHVPSVTPTHLPSHVPSVTPTHGPSHVPSVTPTHGPPTLRPSAFPSQSETPSNEPSAVPTMVPTTTPTALPTVYPTSNPTKMPSVKPSASPSREPSRFPTLNPSTHPSSEPTLSPTSSPSAKPSTAPSGHPSDKPSVFPSSDPTPSPSNMPSRVPTVSPSNHPTQSPSARPSGSPSKQPSVSPSDKPSARPSTAPSSRPTAVPTEVPTNSPTSSIKPSPTPTTVPSASPTLEPSTQPSSSPSSIPPNLVFLLTDEQNFRTLSCYRDYLLSQYNMSSVDVWGDNLSVLTPNIDSLAKDGALFTHFYTSSPLCTPSRGTFMTGLYPPFTGTTRNRGELDPNLKTWADILREERGYRTSYMGKWHLDGDAKPVRTSHGNLLLFDHYE
jgi:Arylsulfatase A and related enzymes